MSATTTTQEPTMPAAPHVYVESDVPEGLTLAEWRRVLEARREDERQAVRRARLEDWSWPTVRMGRGRS